VILWTRVSPQPGAGQPDLAVQWRLAHDAAMTQVFSSGVAYTGPEHDYTVKVDAKGLAPGQVYFYQFAVGDIASPVGRTKTLPPAGVAAVKLAVFTCSNYPAGYFNVYADGALQVDVDCALHLGDYIYEYDRKGYANADAAQLGRLSEPANTLVVLNDYRRRYAQYRTDLDLQALHARMPMIAVWDDHEFSDDSWHNGAPDHDARRFGPFEARKQAAIRAYHEWMPIRAPEPQRLERIYRSFDFGTLVSLHMLDTRLVGRDRQLDMAAYEGNDGSIDYERLRRDAAAPERQMMGPAQCAWLERSVKASKAAWQVVGQQVLMACMEYPLPVACGDMSCEEFVALQEKAQRAPHSLSREQQDKLAGPMLPCYLDSWDGYGGERERLFGIMQRHRKNMVVLAGDSHNAWASNLFAADGSAVGVEFATASVSSPGMECSHRDQDPRQVAGMMEQLMAPLMYAQTSKRGYMILTATREEVRCDYRFVDTVHSRDFSAATERSLRTVAGQHCICEV
jgi:alkaline phosphatase D